MPPVPKLPKSFRAKDLTASSIIFTGIKIGVLSYTSNVEQWGGGGSGRFSPARTVSVVSSVMSVLLVASYPGNNPFLVSISQTNMKSSRNFPRKSIFKNVW